MKNFSLNSFPLSISSIPLGKLGFFAGTALCGQWLLSDVIHIPGGGIGFVILGAAIWWNVRPAKGVFQPPETVNGWLKRCNEVLESFEALEDATKHFTLRKERSKALESIIQRTIPQEIAFASTNGIALPDEKKVKDSISSTDYPVDLTFFSSLPTHDKDWLFPDKLVKKDLLIYFLPLPLRAVDMLWTKNIPDNQPAWLMVEWGDISSWPDQLEALSAQLPDRWKGRILRCDGSQGDLQTVLSPVRRLLAQPKKNIDLTRQRLLSRLHSSWQADLEKLRREKFKIIQSRSQWIVAGVVFASPVPSADLLAIAVVNGLMMKDMSELWSCKMKPELLQAVARQLAGAAIAQGVVEWSGQALLGVAKFHGSGWLAAGTMQALSAAYLTRVVGHSMADWMALNSGVEEVDLNLLKQQAPSLIAKAAKEERVDWSLFVNQAKEWIKLQGNNQRMKKVSTI